MIRRLCPFNPSDGMAGQRVYRDNTLRSAIGSGLGYVTNIVAVLRSWGPQIRGVTLKQLLNSILFHFLLPVILNGRILPGLNRNCGEYTVKH